MPEYLTPTGFELKALVIDGQVIDAGQLGAEQIGTALAELFGGQEQARKVRRGRAPPARRAGRGPNRRPTARRTGQARDL